MFAKKFAALLLVPIALTGCDEEIQIDLPDLANQPYREFYDTIMDPAKICSDVTVAKSNGGVIKGTRDCKLPTNLCTEAGATGCYLIDPNLYGLAPKDHVPENFRKGVAIAGVTGSLIANDNFCGGDGQQGCVATTAHSSIRKTTATSKVPVGEEILGMPGTYNPDFPDVGNVTTSARTAGGRGTLPLCANAVTSNCVLTTAYRAVAPSALRAADIRSGAVIGSVTGNFTTTLPECTASNRTGCIATSRFAAVDRSRVVAGNLETGYRVLAVDGALRPRPANCSADNQTGCVAAAPHKAINKAALSRGNIRSGVVIAGISGDYPSATHPLAGADAGIADLTSATFAAKIKDSQNFEIWDATGTRHVLQGSANLVPSRIASGATIFGVDGSTAARPADCTADGADGCVTTAGFPAINKSLVTPGVIRRGVTLAGVTGAYPSATHPLAANTARKDLEFPADMASGSQVEFFDPTGVVHTVRGSADLLGPRILTGVNLFSVAGSAAARPATCSAHDQQSCVADASHPAYKRSDLNPNMIKRGTVISGLTGTFPSAASRLIGASSAADLSSTSFNTAISTGSAFEFWDATGARYTVTGDANLAASNILSGVTIFGKAGSMADQPPACSLTNTNCLTTATHPSYDPAVLTEGVIKSGVKLGSVTGQYPSAAYRLNGDNGSITNLTQANFNSRMASGQNVEYWDSTGQRFAARGDGDLVGANIRTGQTILGVAGSAVATSSPCTSENADNCVTTSAFPSFQKAKLSAANIKNGVSLLGVTGTYPSASNRLPSAGATKDLTGSNFDASMADNTQFEYWNSAGVRQASRGSGALIPANLTQGTTVFGVAGTIAPTPSNCTGRNQNGCMATGTYPAFQRAALTPGVLKAGVSRYGVTGQYPSAAFPLAGSTAAPDLTAGTFTALHQSSNPFEFFDAAGNRHQGQGDNNLQPGNIDTDVNILGVVGTYLGMHPDRKWDFLSGKTVATVSGRVKTNCRNLADTATYNSGDGNYNSFDDQLLNPSRRIPEQNTWGSTEDVCEADVYQDVSINTSTNETTTCDAYNTDVVCMHKDRFSGLTWRQAGKLNRSNTAFTWSDAKNYCAGLTEAGHSDWRLPTVKESLAAAVNGIHRLKVTYNLGTESTEVYRTNYATWTSSVSSTDSSLKYLVYMALGQVSTKRDQNIENQMSTFHCVRN